MFTRMPTRQIWNSLTCFCIFAPNLITSLTIINPKSKERTGKVEDKSKILRTAPVDMAIVRTNFLTWKMKVRSAANGIGSWEDVFPNEPEKSQIGRWIQNVGDKLYSQEPVYQEFKQMHAHLHHFVGQIYELARLGEKEHLKQMLDEFDKQCEDFLKMIDSYKLVMDSYREQGFSPQIPSSLLSSIRRVK
jgi:hypothetical protein